MTKYIVEVNGKEYEVSIKEKRASKKMKTTREQEAFQISNHDQSEEKKIEKEKADPDRGDINEGKGEIVTAPMSGEILSISVAPDQSVKKDQLIMTLEAMKMETEIVSPVTGIIKKIMVDQGDSCSHGDHLVLIETGGSQ